MSAGGSDERRARRRWRLLPAAFLLLLGWAWVAGSLLNLQAAPAAMAALLVLLWTAGPLLALRRWPPRRALPACVGAGLAWAAIFPLAQPVRSERDWSAGHERTATFREPEPGVIEIDGVRDFRHGPEGPEVVRWERRRYALDALESVDFLIEPVPELPAVAHAMLSFGFAGGERLVVSVETRRERGEEYSAVAGLFRRYELIYVLADERDALALRLNERGHELRIHPIRAEPAALRTMLLAILERAQALGERPEPYHTLRRNCTTSLVRHFEELRGRPLPPDWRILLPAHADALAWELGLIEGAGSLEDARRRHCVRGPVDDSPGGAEFSRALRAR